MGFGIFLIVAGILCLVMRNLLRREADDPYEWTKSNAVITTRQQEKDRVIYYALCDVDGRWVKGDSICYTLSKKKYIKGDRVPVEYHFVKGTERIRFRIIDPELVSLTRQNSRWTAVCLAIGIILIISGMVGVVLACILP